MVIWSMVWVVFMSMVMVCPLVIGVPVLQRVVVSPSSMRAGTSVVLLTEAVAVQPVRGRAVCPPPPPPPTVVDPVRRMSREDEPT